MMHMRKSLALLAMLVITFLPLSLSAATVGSGEEYRIDSNEVIEDNLYAAAADINILGTIEGDALLAGANILINSPIGQDLMVAGGNVTILNEVGQDLRAAGGTILINGDVNGDAMLAGGLITIPAGVTIDGDVYVGAGRLVMDGIVNGDVSVAAGELLLNGRVNGVVEAIVDERFTIGANAVITNGLDYQARQEVVVPDTATVGGEISFEETAYQKHGQADPETIFGILAGLWLFGFLTMAVAAVVLVLTFKKFSNEWVQGVNKRFGYYFAIGLAILLLGPLVFIILLMTGIGLALAFLWLFAWLLMVALAKMYTGVLVGVWLHKLFGKEKDLPAPTWWSALLGTFVLSLLLLVPVLGMLFMCVLLCAMLGSGFLLDWKLHR